MVNLAVFLDEKSGLIYIFSNNIKIIIWNGNNKMLKVLLKQKKTFVQYLIVLFLILSFTVLFLTSFFQYKLDGVKK